MYIIHSVGTFVQRQNSVRKFHCVSNHRHGPFRPINSLLPNEKKK